MGFRYRKSIKIIPGVRVNLSKSGVSTSIGRPGATVNIGHGRVKTTVGLPGSGLSMSKTSKSGSRSSSGRSNSVKQRSGAAATASIPKADRAVLAALQVANLHELDTIARSKSEHALPAAMLAGLIAADSQLDWARQMLTWVFTQGTDPGESRLVHSYLPGMRLPVDITDDVTVEEPLGRNLIGLMLAEWHQSDGSIDAAIDVVEQLEPTQTAMLSLCELYIAAGRYSDVVDTTNGLRNDDDVTALLCVYRAESFRHIGQTEAARAALKEALKSKARSPEIRFRALIEQSATYLAEGKTGLARRSLERLRAEDASYPGLAAALARLEPDGSEANEPDDDEPTTPAPAAPFAFAPPNVPAGWLADPLGRHEHRYWDGRAWTEHVASGGVQSHSPIEPS